MILGQKPPPMGCWPTSWISSARRPGEPREDRAGQAGEDRNQILCKPASPGRRVDFTASNSDQRRLGHVPLVKPGLLTDTAPIAGRDRRPQEQKCPARLPGAGDKREGAVPSSTATRRIA
jgi:hypothetical protein